MRVVLGFPRVDGPDPLAPTLSSAEHLGLGYLAAALRACGHDVWIVNAEIEQLSDEEMVRRTLRHEPQIVGLSPVSMSIKGSLKILSELKRGDPELLTVLGGHLATMAASEIVSREPVVDVVLKGDAEASLSTLTDQSLGSRDFSTIPGAVWRDASGTVCQSRASPIRTNLDDLTPPARDDLELAVRRNGDPSARMLASRGCPYDCSFCTTPVFYTRRPRFRTPSCVVNEMEDVNARFGTSHFWFNDDLFVTGSQENTRWLAELSRILITRNNKFTFRILCRADSFKPSNIHVLDLLCKAGLTHVFLGLESGVAGALEVYNKRTTVADNLRAVHLLRGLGLQLQIGFIMFNPYSTMIELMGNANFLADIDELYRFFPLTRPLSVFPGTTIARRLIQDGLMNVEDYREPLSAYRYRSQGISALASLMQSTYDEFAALDHRLLLAFCGSPDNVLMAKGGHDPFALDAVKSLISNLNLQWFFKVCGSVNNDAINSLEHRELVHEWMHELESTLAASQIVTLRAEIQ